MNELVAAKLIDLNRQFYQTFAVQFSATRARVQPGVRRVLDGLPADAEILDLGCGNGSVARELAQRGHRGVYLGLDFSPGLLAVASHGLPANFHFQQVDLAAPDWEGTDRAGVFTHVFAFAVMHHLPGEGLRKQLIQQVRAVLHTGGHFYHSEWQFLYSPRLRARIQPWERVGLSAEQVDEGDYLMDWRAGGSGLRYAHHFSEAELIHLAKGCGFCIIDTFYSDGEGSRLGLYQAWE